MTERQFGFKRRANTLVKGPESNGNAGHVGSVEKICGSRYMPAAIFTRGSSLSVARILGNVVSPARKVLVLSILHVQLRSLSVVLGLHVIGGTVPKQTLGILDLTSLQEHRFKMRKYLDAAC